jgi:hypothetical protein
VNGFLGKVQGDVFSFGRETESFAATCTLTFRTVLCHLCCCCSCHLCVCCCTAGILLWCLCHQKDPYYNFVRKKPAKKGEGLVDMIRTHGYRPEIESICPDNLADLMMVCWDDNPSKRPTWKTIKELLLLAAGASGGSLESDESINSISRISIHSGGEPFLPPSCTIHAHHSPPLPSTYICIYF